MKFLKIKSLSILLLINFMMPAISYGSPTRIAQLPSASNNTTAENISKLRFVPPPVPDRGSPRGRSRGGASRTDTCKATNQPLTALAPVTKTHKSDESVWGLTLSAHPTFLFYLPYTLTPDSPVEFVLQDEEQNTIYQAYFNPTIRSPGVVKITLPDTIESLKVERMYHWYFLIYCHAAEPIFVEGWVKRIAVNRDLSVRLEKAVPQERIALLAANGIWYDALSYLAELRLADPKDTSPIANWESLLESVGLGAIAKEPLVECCSSSSN